MNAWAARRNLLILRAGDASLHRDWLASEGDERSWDLHISYFGPHAEPFGALPDGVTLSREPGGKYSGLASCFESNPQLLASYDFIGLPDDDLQLTQGSWSRVFETIERTGAVVGQPALDHRSIFAHPVTLQAKKFEYREVNFVEVMTPVFRVAFLRRVIPEFTVTSSGWGLDHIYSKMALEEGATMVVDDRNTFLHTRKIGMGTLYPDLETPLEELTRVLEERQMTGVCHSLVGVRPNGKRVTLGKRDKVPREARKYARMKRAMGLNFIMI
jgi:hypothetical protein